MGDWYLALDDENQGRVAFHIDRLAREGPLLDEPDTRQLGGKLRELRFYLGGRATRITYWIAPGAPDHSSDSLRQDDDRNDARFSERSWLWSAVWLRNTPPRKTMTDRRNWNDTVKPRSDAAGRAYDDEARISEFREIVYRVRTEAGLTQAELAERMGTTQSAVARIEGGGTRPSLNTLEKLAVAVGQELVVGLGERLSTKRSIAKLVRDGHAVVRNAG